MARDYKKEYQRRLARARERGQSSRQARGHGKTPDRPLQAYLHPERFPEYVAKHYRKLNEIARSRGEPQVGRGIKGYDAQKEAEERFEEGRRPLPENWTYIVAKQPQHMRFSYAYRTKREAEEYARVSGASPGTVLIWVNPKTGFYEVYFLDYSGKKKNPKKWTVTELKKYNDKKRKVVEKGLK
jgi:hypothetical protein